MKIENLTPKLVKEKVRYKAVPDNEVWRVSVARELLKQRNSDIEVPGFTELDEILTYICKM